VGLTPTWIRHLDLAHNTWKKALATRPHPIFVGKMHTVSDLGPLPKRLSCRAAAATELRSGGAREVSA
jgi:hypothetical protein